MGALKPTVSGIGFYLHKDFGAAEVGILSTQRMSRGRDLDFIYATNSARPGSDVDLHKRFMGPWFNTKSVRQISTILSSQNNFRAARACSSEFIENNEWALTDLQSSMIDGA